MTDRAVPPRARPTPTGARANGPLSGLRVLDLSQGIAGAYATKMLADAGADVVRAEPPGGDPLRRWSSSGATLSPGEDGALFGYLHASKRSVCVDLDTAGGRERALRLARACDVLVESFGPGGLEARGLEPERLAQAHPALTIVSISPWGRSGPWAKRPADEFTLQAATGATAHRGIPGREPVAAGGRIGEWIAGAFAAEAAVASWFAARASGRGQHVDLSLFEAMLLSLTYYFDLTGQWGGARPLQAIEVPSIEPARDGWVGFCTVTGQQWLDFCAMIEAPELARERRYLDGRERSADHARVRSRIHRWTRERSVAEIVDLASAFRVPAVPVTDGARLPSLEAFAARRVFVEGADGVLRPRPPYRLGRAPWGGFGPAPRLGEHEREVLAEWGPRTNRQAGAGDAPPPLPLEGVRVLDLGTFWAGPFASQQLAAFGADVIKIESVQRPDGMRFAGGLRRDPIWEWSPIFAGTNAGKRGITLRLDDAEGRELFERLAARSDVVLENFSPRVLDGFGLGWERLRALNPRLVLVRMPAFGLDGPWRERPGFAMTVEQVSGLAWLTGYPDQPLVVRGACDPLAGVTAAFAVLLALEHRRRTGEGQLVEVPLVEAALNVAAELVLEHAAYGRALAREGNRSPWAAPRGVYRCREPESWIALSVASDAQWEGLRRALGDPDWAADPALATLAGRRAAHDRIDRELSLWLATLGCDEALERLLEAGVPAHPLVDGHRVMPNPQLEARGFFQLLDHAVTGCSRYPGLPMSFSAWSRSVHRRPPPRLGEHNEEVLGGELGLSSAELERLEQRGVIGRRPSFELHNERE